MKKIVSVIFIFCLLFSFSACQTTAVSKSTASDTNVLGDADGDGILTISDATAVQRHLAKIDILSAERQKTAKVSTESALSLTDVTLIQQRLAEFIDVFPAEEQEASTETGEKEMILKVNGAAVSVDWEDNAAVSALKEAVKDNPLTIQMSMYGGFEQVGSFGMSLPQNDTRITTSPGDIVLYTGSQMVMFYGSNTWAYTRLGKIKDKTQAQLTEMLSNGNVTVTILVG